MKMPKMYLIPILFIIGILVFLFGSPQINEKLKEKNSILGIVLQKLEILESISKISTSEMQKIANDTQETYLKTMSELCRKQYFYLKTDCELSDLNKSNLLKLSQILETGILEIVEAEKLY